MEQTGRSSDETSSDSDDDGPVVYARRKLVPKSQRPPAAGAGTALAPETPPAEAATEGGAKRRCVSSSTETASLPKRLHKKARRVSQTQQVSASVAEAQGESRRRKIARFRVRRGSLESPSTAAVAIVENEQLYVALTDDTLWSRQLDQRSKQAKPGATCGWNYLGNAVRVLDMAADGRYLYALDQEGVTWRVDRRESQRRSAATGLDGECGTAACAEAAQWTGWDVAPAPLLPPAISSRSPNRCIAICGGFMYAIDDEHRLLRTALDTMGDERSTGSVVMGQLVPATVRQWSTVPAWEAFSRADEDKIPIGVTSSRESILVACADGTICMLPQLSDAGSTDTAGKPSCEQGQAISSLKLPLLPTQLWTEWTSLAAADTSPASTSGQHLQRLLQSEQASQWLRLFASAVTQGNSSLQTKRKRLPVVHCLCSDGEDVWSLHQPGDRGARFGDGTAGSVSSCGVTSDWRVEELSVSRLDPTLATSPSDSCRDGRTSSSKKKQRTSGASASEKQDKTSDAAEVFRSNGHEWIGKRVKRMVIRQVDAMPIIADAVIFQWWPKGNKKDEPAMWKIKYTESESKPDAAISEPDLIHEDLLEKEAKDAIHSATPDGLAALQAVQNRILDLDQIATQRRDEFIRSQPAFAADQQAGRQSLVSGYLVWVFSEGKWWPAQIYTPLSYIHSVLLAHNTFTHFIAKQICDSAKPDSLFVVFLNKIRQFEWAAWRAQPPGAQQQQARVCVHDFRKHYRQHKAATSGTARLAALQEAEELLSGWLGNGEHEYGEQQATVSRVADDLNSTATKPSPPKPVPSTNWRSVGHVWVGRQVKRWRVRGSHDQQKISDGRIIAWKPKAHGRPAMWKVEFHSHGGALGEEYEELYEDDARDAIECANPNQGFPALQALQKRIMAMDVVCMQRRDQFIRSQPAFVEDQSAGRRSLISGYLVFARYDAVWWPAQLYTPLTYMKEYAGYSHTIAKQIVHTMKPERVFVTYLDTSRTCSWVRVGDVHDFRLYRSRHVDVMMKDKELRRALRQADATLANWIQSSVAEATSDSEAPTGGSTSSRSKLACADPIPLSPREPVRLKGRGEDSVAKVGGSSSSICSADKPTCDDVIALDISSVAAKKHISRAGGAGKDNLSDAARSTDADVTAALRDAAREVLAQFAQKVRVSKGAVERSIPAV